MRRGHTISQFFHNEESSPHRMAQYSIWCVDFWSVMFDGRTIMDVGKRFKSLLLALIADLQFNFLVNLNVELVAILFLRVSIKKFKLRTRYDVLITTS